jgi:hypothetical protein
VGDDLGVARQSGPVALSKVRLKSSPRDLQTYAWETQFTREIENDFVVLPESLRTTGSGVAT